MDHLIQDLRYTVRALLREPGFAAIAVLTLSLSIGANTAIFSVINGLFFKGVPGLSDTDGLVEVSRNVEDRFFGPDESLSSLDGTVTLPGSRFWTPSGR